MPKNYDCIVLGAGNAGQAAARRAKRAGQSVLIVESRDVGGTCPLRGCVPKKVLVAAAEALHQISIAEEHHISAGPAKLDWKKLIERKETFVEGVPESFEKGLAKAEIDLLHGKAAFVERNTIEVDGRQYQGKKVVIATGSKPANLPIEGFEHAITSDDILARKQQPGTLVFIGAGVIGMEFTHVFARAGTQVTVLEIAPRPLPVLDEDLVNALVDDTSRLGVEFFTEAGTKSIQKQNGSYLVRFVHQGETKTLTCDTVANGAGRVPAIDDLNLEATGVEVENGSIVVDDHLRSVSNPAIFVAGDALGKSRALSPVATYEGKIVGHNLTNNDLAKPDYDPIPNVLFTVPALASVGLSEQEARDHGREFDARLNDMKDWRSAKTHAETAALSKVLVEKETDKILGAHVLGHSAQEIIHTFAFAIRYGITAQQLRDFIYAYPTNTSDIRFLV